MLSFMTSWQRNGPQTNQLSGRIFKHNLGNSPIALPQRKNKCHSDVNRGWIQKEKDKDQAFKDTDKDYTYKEKDNTRVQNFNTGIMGQLPNLCVRIRILMHRIINFYSVEIVGAFF